MDASDETEALIVVGRRAGDGSVRLAIFTRELLELTVEAHGERASTLLLTRAQIGELQRALDHLGGQLAAQPGTANEQNGVARGEHEAKESWDGAERRKQFC